MKNVVSSLSLSCQGKHGYLKGLSLIHHATIEPRSLSPFPLAKCVAAVQFPDIQQQQRIEQQQQ